MPKCALPFQSTLRFGSGSQWQSSFNYQWHFTWYVDRSCPNVKLNFESRCVASGRSRVHMYIFVLESHMHTYQMIKITLQLMRTKSFRFVTFMIHHDVILLINKIKDLMIFSGTHVPVDLTGFHAISLDKATYHSSVWYSETHCKQNNAHFYF